MKADGLGLQGVIPAVVTPFAADGTAVAWKQRLVEAVMRPSSTFAVAATAIGAAGLGPLPAGREASA